LRLVEMNESAFNPEKRTDPSKGRGQVVPPHLAYITESHQKLNCVQRDCIFSSFGFSEQIKPISASLIISQNPKGIPSSSPWLRRRSYHGSMPQKNYNSNGVATTSETVPLSLGSLRSVKTRGLQRGEANCPPPLLGSRRLRRTQTRQQANKVD